MLDTAPDRQSGHARQPGPTPRPQSATNGGSPGRAVSATQPRSLVLLNTGDGKGKTTAALGVVARALARGWRVEVIQFLKSDGWQSGEETILRRLGVEWTKGGDGFTWSGRGTDGARDRARAAWEQAARGLAREDLQLLVLDEITFPIALGWLDEAEVADAIRGRVADVNVILTGRRAPTSLLDLADIVTEMRNIRHPFDRGVVARAGIDF